MDSCHLLNAVFSSTSSFSAHEEGQRKQLNSNCILTVSFQSTFLGTPKRQRDIPSVSSISRGTVAGGGWKMNPAVRATLFLPVHFINHQTGRKIHEELLSIKTLFLFQEVVELQIAGSWENVKKGPLHVQLILMLFCRHLIVGTVNEASEWLKLDEAVVWSDAISLWNIHLFWTNSCSSVGCIFYFCSVGQGYKSDWIVAITALCVIISFDFLLTLEINYPPKIIHLKYKIRI